MCWAWSAWNVVRVVAVAVVRFVVVDIAPKLSLVEITCHWQWKVTPNSDKSFAYIHININTYRYVCVCVWAYALFQVLTMAAFVAVVVRCSLGAWMFAHVWATVTGSISSSCSPTPPAHATPIAHTWRSHMLSPVLWQFIDIHLPLSGYVCVCVCWFTHSILWPQLTGA